MEKTKQQQGFTLIELLVTIVIAAILISIAVPWLQTMMTNNRIEATANRLRNEFIAKRNKAIETRTSQTVSSVTDFASTLTKIVDNDNEGNIIIAADGTIENDTDLEHIVYSICKGESYSSDKSDDIKELALVVYPSGLVSIKSEAQIVNKNTSDTSDDTEDIECN